MADSQSRGSSPLSSQKEEKPAVEVVEDEYPRRAKLALYVVALVLAMFLCSLDMTIVSTAIPKITEQFSALDSVGWIASSFLLTVGSSQAVFGKLYKYFDLKIVFLVSIGIFELGSLISGVAQNVVTLIVGRAICGLGAAGTLAGCYSIIAFAVPPQQRPAFSGILGGVYGLASVIGPLLGGILTDRASWRWVFLINLPIGGLSIAIIAFFFKTPSASKNTDSISMKEKLLQMDVPGALILMASICCYLLVTQYGGVARAWNSPTVIGLLVGAITIFILFLGLEYIQGEQAMLSPRLLRKRVNRIGFVFTFFFGGAFFVLLYYIPIYFQAVKGASPAASGIDSLPMVLAVTLFVIFGGVFVTKTGYFAPLFILGSVIATVGSALVYTFELDSSSAVWIGYQALAGAGIGLAFQGPVMAAQALAEPEDISAVTGMMLFGQTIGAALFVSAAQSIFQNTLLKNLIANVPTLDPMRVLGLGATGLQEAFTGAELRGVLGAYMVALKDAYVLAIAVAGVSVLISVWTPWTNIKGKAVAGAV